MKKLLADYRGSLHSDQYGVYEQLAKEGKMLWHPCWAHVRRKFVEAEGGRQGVRLEILRLIKYLFWYERVAQERPFSERLAIRKAKEQPLIDQLDKLVHDELKEGLNLPKFKFTIALNYYARAMPYLKNYLDAPEARLDNNVAERAIRPLAIGRKNWLFAGSVRGGRAAAVILSFVQTCRGLGINPRDYLVDVMRRLMGHANNKLEELLPAPWAKGNSQEAIASRSVR